MIKIVCIKSKSGNSSYFYHCQQIHHFVGGANKEAVGVEIVINRLITHKHFVLAGASVKP